MPVETFVPYTRYLSCSVSEEFLICVLFGDFSQPQNVNDAIQRGRHQNVPMPMD
jgi:hypothetical protein